MALPARYERQLFGQPEKSQEISEIHMGVLLGSGSDRPPWSPNAGTKRTLGNAGIVLETLKLYGGH